MLCEGCQQREAVVKFTQVIGSQKKIVNLCKECAEKQGLNNPLMDLSKVFGRIIISLISEHLAFMEDRRISEDDKVICEECRCTWGEFKRKGRLGCANCYETFNDNLKVLLRRIHGNNRHIGGHVHPSRAKQKDSLPSLKKKLQAAIEKEEYERAAELRDRIRELKQVNKETSTQCQTS